MYEDLTVAELDALIAAGRISLDDYWQARIALDLRLEQQEHENRFDLAAGSGAGSVGQDDGDAAGSFGTATASDEDIVQSLRGDLSDTRRDASTGYRYREPAEGRAAWVDPPPMPRYGAPPTPDPGPMVSPPPGRSPFSEPGTSWVRLPIPGPSADAAPTRANDGRDQRRWWRRRRR
ncbi:hypothetical protein SAMN05892883_1789 [Jatrophihabitans sp. GAS493]|uniref:hypothetical protein n=1 Tax=Jatrophihabitans sp. GAS493 TaxID=1907575 RepID=UPI000BB6EC75|nr:hypothetical protein [Jatrophihabitans sp. GAS493]SOD72390.1 hypothetical protein SAMN05892883_1789 [Jatrophihabitans sp. GAS493]